MLVLVDEYIFVNLELKCFIFEELVGRGLCD